MNNTSIQKFIWIFHFIWLFIMCILMVSGGVRHDYEYYLQQWSQVYSSQKPWMVIYYGPIHILLAYMLVLGPLGPKILMCTAFMCMNSILVSRLQKVFNVNYNAILIYLLAIPLNGLIIFAGFWYGLNDLFTASFIIAAILARLDRKFYLIGVLIGFAALIKYYPLLFLPFLMFDERCIRLRPGFTALLVFSLGIGVAWLFWGNYVFISLEAGVTREAKLLSILASLNVHSWLIGGSGIVEWMVKYNTQMVVVATVLVIWVSWRSGLSWLSSFVVGILTILLSYKVGHPQLYIPWLTAIAFLPLLSTKLDFQTAWICIPFAIFLSVFQSMYTLGNNMQGPWLIVRHNIGFVSFILGFLIICRVIYLHKHLPKRTLIFAW